MEKICTKCKAEKPLDDFHTAKHHKDGRRSACKECGNAVSRKWMEANSDRFREYKAQWVKANPDKVKAQAVNWHKNHPGRTAERVARRRALRLAYEGSHYTARDVIMLMESQAGLCSYCGVVLGGYHVDHVVPLSRGGDNSADNIVLACQSCNLSKHNRLLGYEWCQCGEAQKALDTSPVTV